MDWYTRVGGGLGDGWKEWKGVSGGRAERFFSPSFSHLISSMFKLPSLSYGAPFFGSIVKWKMMLEL